MKQFVEFSRELESRLPSLQPLIERISRIVDFDAWLDALEAVKKQSLRDGILPAQEEQAAYILLDLPMGGHRLGD